MRTKMEHLYTRIREHGNLPDEEIMDAARHGADNGYNGFIYPAESAEFFSANRVEIWELLREDAGALGTTIPEMISQFRRIDMAETPDGHDCLLAWYVLESVGHWLIEEHFTNRNHRGW